MGESFSESPVFKDQLSVSSSTSPSLAPSPRPGLSRANSVNYSVEADDALTGLTLLDALVVLDSHLDLARRQISRKGLEWKSRAESTAIQVKRQAEEVLNQRRTRRRVTPGSGGSASGSARTSNEEDRIDIDRELAKFRQNIQARVTAVRTKWKDQRVVSLRDRLSFFFGVELVLISALLVGFKPEWVPGVYTALSMYLFPIRIYEYRKKHYSLFLADLCYIVNVLCLVYLWIFPNSPILFVACYCLSHGPLCTAIATWRNSLVFHSVDKVTSLFIHIYPPFVFTVLVHFYPNVADKYPALGELSDLHIMRSLIFSSIAYLIWQVAYYYGIVVARKDKIEKEGRITSFTYMLSNKRSLIGKTLAKIPPSRREPSFMAGQFVYTIVTMAPSAIWLYSSKILSVLWLITFFSVSVWNGASFYFKVMANYKEVAALKKELDELQKVANGTKTPGSAVVTPSAGPGDVPADISLGPSVVDSPILGASGASPEIAQKALNSQKEDARTAQETGSPNSSKASDPDDSFKLDEEARKSIERSRQPSLSESDSSAVVVEAEDGQEGRAGAAQQPIMHLKTA